VPKRALNDSRSLRRRDPGPADFGLALVIDRFSETGMNFRGVEASTAHDDGGASMGG
jgi:hypothetical protein